MWVRRGLNVVQDRCLLSDLVYAPVWMGVPSRLGEVRVRDELISVARHAVVFHVTASEEVLLDRMRERADGRPAADPPEAQRHALLKHYWREVGWWQSEGAVVIEVDTTEGNFPAGLELEMLLSIGLETFVREHG
jgi:hypothetical protein